MESTAFASGDWVEIRYGEKAGHFGKICMHEKSGNYMVIPYDNDEPCEMVSLAENSIVKIEPRILSLPEFRDIIRGKRKYKEFEPEIFPAFNVRPEKAYKMTAKDISTALGNINKTDRPLTDFKEWFWLIINVFYNDLKISGRYKEDCITEIPATEDEVFSDCFGMTEKLYWRLEERFVSKEDNERHVVKFDDEPNWDGDSLNNDEIEKTAYFTVCDDIISRVGTFRKNKGEPKEEWEYSNGQKKMFLTACEDKGLGNISREELRRYKKFVYELADENDLQALKILAWSYYERTEAFPQNWKLSAEYLKKVYRLSGDPFAANSLGYIYYYGRTNGGIPQYEEAFRYFSFGALAGIDESLYKCADMLIYGRGTEKNIDMGLNMIIDGYRDTLYDFCHGIYESKFADYALRMGNVCSDNLIYGMGIRDAYKFYLEAEYAIKKRREKEEYFGDDVVENRIKAKLEQIRRDVGLDLNRKTIKSDFPIYINQLYDDPFPVQVMIRKERNGRVSLKMKRFRIGQELLSIPIPEKLKEVPNILVCYPELSYCGLTTELSFKLENAEILKRPGGRDYFLSDGFKKNEMTNALEFYSNGELVAAVEAEKFVIEIKR